MEKNQFKLVELLAEKRVEDRLRKKTERHLTQDDIRNLIRNRRSETNGVDADRQAANESISGRG